MNISPLLPPLLLARPALHLARSQAAFHAAGFTHIISIELSTSEPINLPARASEQSEERRAGPQSPTAYLLTSAHAIQKDIKPLPTYCVGPTTATAAQKAGLPVVFTGNNNAEALAQAILTLNLPPQHFVHLHGPAAPLEWHQILQNHGHTVTPVLAYRTTLLPALPADTSASLTATPPAYTALFSPQSTLHLHKLLKQANILPTGIAVALSPAVAQAATPLWPQVLTAPTPSLEALVRTTQAHQAAGHLK